MNYHDITVKLADGRTILFPDQDLSRRAFSALSSVASKIVGLRKILKDHDAEIPANIKTKLNLIAAPFAFEEQICSSNLLTKCEGIENFTSNELHKTI